MLFLYTLNLRYFMKMGKCFHTNTKHQVKFWFLYTVTIKYIYAYEVILTFSRLMTYIYMSYRTANLQMLHFIYLFNKYTYWIF